MTLWLRPAGRRSRPRHQAQRPLTLERLEDRSVPAVTLGTNFPGMDYNSTLCECVPPDSHLAAGPGHLVEVVNTAVRFYSKAGRDLGTEELTRFFNLKPDAFLTDPKVSYDELGGHFLLTVVSIDFTAERSYVLFAASRTADPTGKWEKHRIEVTAATDSGEKLWGDYPIAPNFEMGDSFARTFVSTQTVPAKGDPPWWSLRRWRPASKSCSGRWLSSWPAGSGSLSTSAS